MRNITISSGSATECAACLDALVAKQACSLNRIQSGKDILLRIVSMLSKLVAKFESTATPGTVLREEPAQYSG